MIVALLLGATVPAHGIGSFCSAVFFEKPLASSSRLFLNEQVQRLSALIAEGGAPVTLHNRRPRLPAFRRDFFNYLYGEGLVRYGEVELLLADKLIFTEYLKKSLGVRFSDYHMKGEGLKSFLQEQGLLDSSGRVLRDEARLRHVFKKEFPNGFVIKPLLVANSAAGGMITKIDVLVRRLLDDSSSLYHRNEGTVPSEVTSAWAGETKVASGERYLIQEKVGLSALDVSKEQAFQKVNEYRVHTFDRHVVPDATVARWYGNGRAREMKAVDDFISRFLREMPAEFSRHRAFSFDVFYSEGQMKIIELNSNFGRPGSWSGFTSEPSILGAYVRFFESQYGWQFQGHRHRRMLREDLGNMKVYLKNELIFYKEQFFEGEAIPVLVREINKLAVESKRYHEHVPLDNRTYGATLELIDAFLKRWKAVSSKDKTSFTHFFNWVEGIEAY